MKVNPRRSALSALLGVVLLSCVDGPTAPRPMGPRANRAPGPVPQILISQVYGAGGNSGANFRNDFVELFNPGTAAVDITGWKVQYTSAAGTTWGSNAFTLPAGSIAAGKY